VSSLPESIIKIGQELVSYYANGKPAGTPPYTVYVYSPKEEFRVRTDLNDLRAWLATRDVTCLAVSLADLFWRAIDDSGYGDQIVAQEEESPGDSAALEYVNTAISQILTGPPSLADRLMEALAEAPPRSAAFLYRAGALYPTYRTSSILDDLRERLLLPVVLLYPGRVVGLYGLSFMGRCDPTHGYRATIIPREGA
jgi:hypothetical protein